MNDSGDVAFLALPSGSVADLSGIYVGDGSRLDRVISPGDALFGGTVQELYFEQGNLNNSGQLLFAYQLGNGTFGVAVATPIPEPACWAAAAASCPLLSRRRSSSPRQSRAI